MKKKYAKDIDKEQPKKKKVKKEKVTKEKRKIKKTTLDTIPYQNFVSNSVLLLRSDVRIGKETANIYSKTYQVEDANYSSLPEEEQTAKLQIFVNLLNGFDANTSLQLTIINAPIDEDNFNKTILLQNKNDGFDDLRQEFNEVIRKRVLDENKGLYCSKYLTVAVIATDFSEANTKFFNLESHLTTMIEKIGSKLTLLTANQRIKLLGKIFRENSKIDDLSLNDISNQAEKMEIAPDYFEFKKDYFMFEDKFARCLYFRKLSTSILDTIYNDIIDKRIPIIISENLDFVDKGEAETLLQRKLTDMNQEQINKTRKAAAAARGAFVDPIKGSQLERDKEYAQEFLEDIQNRGQKMIRAQFVIMLTATSHEELDANTEALNILLRKYQIETINAPYRQEVAMSSVLPIGNSCSYDKEQNIQVRRTLSSESVAGFMPFNSVELMHSTGVFYGINEMSKNIIFFDRNKLKNPNGFLFGVPGSGKSMTAKLEILFSILATEDEVVILDPEREYTALVESLGGEVIYISPTSSTHINPMDLVPNPDESDKEYNPITAKLDLLLSFFSTLLGDKEVSPIQKSIIDDCMRKVYNKYDEPTLVELYDELDKYEKEQNNEVGAEASYLKNALQLYSHGSMNFFSKKSNVNIHKRIVVYDIKSLGKNLSSLGMVVVLENIWNLLAKNRVKGLRTRIYIDEMYLMFKSENSSNFFYELYKRARKWGGIPTGMTQNVGDVLRSPNAQAMLDSTEFVILLSQNTNDREMLAHLLSIPLDTMKYVTKASSGCGLIHARNVGDIPFDGTFPTDTKIYKLITTKFKEDEEDKKLSLVKS